MKIETTINEDGDIVHTTLYENCEGKVVDILELKEVNTRAALVSLGWTPPNPEIHIKARQSGTNYAKAKVMSGSIDACLQAIFQIHKQQQVIDILRKKLKKVQEIVGDQS